MKSTTKPCRHCWKEMPKWLANVCSFKCNEKYVLQKEKEKKKALKAKKQVSIASLSKVADILWSRVVRTPWACEYCGKKDYLNAHHIFGRNNKSVRWEKSNGICLCSGCHTFSNEFSAHKTPSEFTYWLEGVRWRDYMDKLQELAHIPMKVTPEYLQEQILYFKKELNDL